jgi:hypothetical protein
VAYARNHPTLDGPDQSVWLRSASGSAVQLRKLGADSEWITAIVWSVDSRRIAFLTMDAVLDVYDVASRSRLASGYVLPNRGDYPPRYAVRDVSFSIDGGAVTFLPCERNYDVTNDRPERLTCRDSRESLTIAELADRQARLYQGRVF